MQFEGAIIREQGITFAVVIVKHHILRNSAQANSAISAFQPTFPGLPVVLMGQDTAGRPNYFGRRDIARFLSRVPMQAIPWKRYTLN